MSNSIAFKDVLDMTAHQEPTAIGAAATTGQETAVAAVNH